MDNAPRCPDGHDEAFVARFAAQLQARFGVNAASMAWLGDRALVAGSFPLQVELDETWEDSDMDVYAHARDVPAVMAAFVTQGYACAPCADVVTSAYASSGFLARNKIKGILTLRKAGAPPVQIMAVRHAASLASVVANFDLTPCSIAYAFGDAAPRFLGDGASREAVHARTGALRSTYASLYFSVNATLHARVAKYERRGFALALPSFPEHARRLLAAAQTAVPRDPFPPEGAEMEAWYRRKRAQSALLREEQRDCTFEEWVRRWASYDVHTAHKSRVRAALALSGLQEHGYDSDDEEDVARVKNTGRAATLAALDAAHATLKEAHAAFLRRL